jgi:hypothetical protein
MGRVMRVEVLVCVIALKSTRYDLAETTGTVSLDCP